MCIRDRISVDLLMNAVGARARKALAVCIAAVSLGVLTVMFWYGWAMAERTATQSLAGLTDPILISLVTQLCVEPLRPDSNKDETDYIAAVLARLQHLAANREVAALKGRLQRMNPVNAPEDYQRIFGELISLEQQAKVLGERGMGGQP